MWASRRFVARVAVASFGCVASCAQTDDLDPTTRGVGGDGGSGAMTSTGGVGAAPTGGAAGAGVGGSVMAGGASGAGVGGMGGTGGVSGTGGSTGGAGGDPGIGGTSGSTGGAGTGGAGTGGMSGSASGGSSGGCTELTNAPGLCAPNPAGAPCSEPGFGGSFCPGGGVCRIAETGGRCDDSGGGAILGRPCSANAECLDEEQCYQGQCWWICKLGDAFFCSGPCMNIGHPQFGVCNM